MSGWAVVSPDLNNVRGTGLVLDWDRILVDPSQRRIPAVSKRSRHREYTNTRNVQCAVLCTLIAMPYVCPVDALQIISCSFTRPLTTYAKKTPPNMFLITFSKRVELIYRYKVSALRCSPWPPAVEMSLTVLLFSPNCFLFFLASLQRDLANPEVTPYKIL